MSVKKLDYSAPGLTTTVAYPDHGRLTVLKRYCFFRRRFCVALKPENVGKRQFNYRRNDKWHALSCTAEIQLLHREQFLPRFVGAFRSRGYGQRTADVCDLNK